jgi:DNA-binding MarR family transcriptional regulator
MENAAVELDEELQCVNLQMLRTSHFILHTYDEAYRPFGVRATQLPVLGLIARLGPVSIKALAAEMASERSVLSRKLQVMEKNGWIREHGGTGKEKHFVLSRDGAELLESTETVRLDVQRRLLARLGAGERALLLSLCGKLGGKPDGG